MRELSPAHLFGFVDARPLKSPQPAEQAARYISKYLAKWQDDGSLEVSETVKAAGRTLLNYVSRDLTGRSGVMMRALRLSRVVWAWLEGLIPDPCLDPWDELVAVCLLDRRPVPVRGALTGGPACPARAGRRRDGRTRVGKDRSFASSGH